MPGVPKTVRRVPPRRTSIPQPLGRGARLRGSGTVPGEEGSGTEEGNGTEAGSAIAGAAGTRNGPEETVPERELPLFTVLRQARRTLERGRKPFFFFLHILPPPLGSRRAASRLLERPPRNILLFSLYGLMSCEYQLYEATALQPNFHWRTAKIILILSLALTIFRILQSMGVPKFP